MSFRIRPLLMPFNQPELTRADCWFKSQKSPFHFPQSSSASRSRFVVCIHRLVGIVTAIGPTNRSCTIILRHRLLFVDTLCAVGLHAAFIFRILLFWFHFEFMESWIWTFYHTCPKPSPNYGVLRNNSQLDQEWTNRWPISQINCTIVPN